MRHTLYSPNGDARHNVEFTPRSDGTVDICINRGHRYEKTWQPAEDARAWYRNLRRAGWTAERPA